MDRCTPRDISGIIARMHAICCNPILPTAYSDALSYEEQLAQLSCKLNEVIDRLNEFTGEYESYVAEQLAPYQAQLDTLENKLNGTLDGVDAKIAELETLVSQSIRDNQNYVNSVTHDLRAEVTEHITESRDYVYTKVSELTAEVEQDMQTLRDDVERYVTGMISQQLTEIYAYIDSHNDDIKVWVQLKLDEFLASLPDNGVIVINPITGVVDTLQNALNALANASKYYTSLTCQEWDALGLTAEGFDAKLLTAFQIDWQSKELLQPHRWAYMFSPFSGEWVTIASVVDQLADLHKTEPPETGPLTAGEYDALMITASAYDALNVTAYNYDWHGKEYVHN